MAQKERIIYLDLLRVIAVFSMIVLHVAANKFYTEPVSSFHWKTLVVYDSFVRFCVPVFVMISGALFLNPQKQISIKDILQKNVLRIIIAYAFWSILYSAFSSGLYQGNFSLPVIKTFVKNAIFGHYHLWFCYMIVGLYLIVPFLKKITVDKKLTRYFILLGFVFAILMPACAMIPRLNIIDQIAKKTNLYFALGYTVYFAGGYYLFANDLSKRVKIILYALAVLSVAFTIWVTIAKSVEIQTPYEEWFQYLLPNTAFVSVGVFLFAKDVLSKIKLSDKAAKAILTISKLSFSIYLVHDFINILFQKIRFTTSAFPVLSVPVISLCVFACGLIISYALSKIPVIKKYII